MSSVQDMPARQAERRSVAGYTCHEDYFGAPYIDADEQRSDPVPHRYVHGGFANSATRFAIYLPEASLYRGRFFQPLGGGLGGDEFSFAGPHRDGDPASPCRRVPDLARVRVVAG